MREQDRLARRGDGHDRRPRPAPPPRPSPSPRRRRAPRRVPGVRLQTRTSSNGSTARIASRWERACVPAPRIASVARLGPREQPRRDPGDRRRADRRDRPGVDQRPHLARLAAEERDEALVAVEPAGRVARRDADGLDCVQRLGATAVGGHHPEQRRRAGRADDEAERVVELPRASDTSASAIASMQSSIGSSRRASPR